MDLRVKSEDIDRSYLKDQTEKDGSVTWLKEKAELVKKVDYSTELIKKLEERIFFLKAQTDVAGERLSNFEAQTNKKISILKAEAALKDLQLKEFMNSTNQLFTQSEEKAERRHKALIEELFQKDKKISLLEQQVSSLQTGFSDASQGIFAEQGNSTSIKTLDLMKMKRKRKLVETGSDHKSSQSSPSRPSSSSCSDSESECKKVKSVLQQKKSYSHINNTTTITATTTDSTTTTATAPTVTTTTATTSLNGTSSSSCNTFSDKNIADKDGKTGITTSSSQEEFTCVEDDRGRKRLLCTVPECGKMFKNINGIKYHMKNSHRDSHEPRKSAKSAKTSTKTSDPVKLKGKRKLMETGSGHKSSPSSPSSPSSSSSSSSSESESECKKVKRVLQQEKSSRHINNTTTITATATDSTTTSATTTTATTTTATTSGNGTSSSSCNTFSNKNIADNS